MPNFDGGHYFLSVLAPIRTGAFERDGKVQTHLHKLREVLDLLPTAQQSEGGQHPGCPFARSRSTHFARFNVIDDVVYNGRLRIDPIFGPLRAKVAAAAGRPLPAMQTVDRLSTPYLFLAIDFDVESGDDNELERYLTELWRLMEPELVSVFEHCVGFERVKDAASFVRYVKDCQVETTMPFNDYWAEPPGLKDRMGELKAALAAAAVAGIALVVAILSALFSWSVTLVSLAVAVLALVLAVYLAHRDVLRLGAQPFEAAPNSKLPTVLKAIHLQQRFVRFAIRHQLSDPETLHQAFKDFVAEHRPDDLDDPTQAPGVVRS
jgi:hypothetical protein